MEKNVGELLKGNSNRELKFQNDYYNYYRKNFVNIYYYC